MRTYEVTSAEVAEQQTVVVRGHVDHEGIGPFINRAMGELMDALGQAGQEPGGAPFSRYRVGDDGGWDIEVGVPVHEDFTVPPPAERSTLPGGKVARTLHRGPYGELAGAYQATERWVQENAMRQSGDPWEVYLDDPSVTEPRTEIFLPCTEAHR